MNFPHPLIEGTLIQRYKRFLADVRFSDGSVETVHCPNPGAMLGLTEGGNRVWVSDSRNPKRKLRCTLELMEVSKTLVGINTNWPNKLAVEAIENGVIPMLSDYENLRTEVRYGHNSRIDILLEGGRFAKTYVEVKNVHLRRQPGLHEFPDCVTARGAKHLVELTNEVKSGNRAVMLFVIQREDGDGFALARDIDPQYGKAFDAAVSAGVEVFAIRCSLSPQGITADTLIPVLELA